MLSGEKAPRLFYTPVYLFWLFFIEVIRVIIR